ncbi:hypothetical protein [Mycobacterium vicinigordonae]|uniref:VCBS repeat-containing protein n=1 Tax=Mycobacterium vicinigordonae TaxID=1719132 RepID=A0A7D6E3Q3_9MYCO|nr:hypothetical protein [Mycobacterium vicinigordonae]QLL08226.1 hypothetical protein H0P51_04460 [Mycobacterium vicinigordonae]
MLRALAAAVVAAAGWLSLAPATHASPGCPPGGAALPPGSVQRQVGDLDGDGLPDALWIGLAQGENGATTRLLGVSTASGARIAVPVISASPIPLRALAIDAQQNGDHQILVSDGRGAYLYAFAQCELQAVVDNHYGKPFVFDLQNLRDTGTGIGCSDLGDGRRLVALQALDDGVQWTVRRTEINLDGTRATTGRSDTLTAASPQDPEVTSAHTISCGNLTIDQDGVQQP